MLVPTGIVIGIKGRGYLPAVRTQEGVWPAAGNIPLPWKGVHVLQNEAACFKSRSGFLTKNPFEPTRIIGQAVVHPGYCKQFTTIDLGSIATRQVRIPSG